MMTRQRFFAFLIIVLLFGGNVFAELTPARYFSNHAVLLKGRDVPVFGWGAAPGEEITVSLDSVSNTAKAAPDGRWEVLLDLSQSGPGPFELCVSGSKSYRFKNVCVGEVWLCSGQSNMEMALENTYDAEAELASAADPLLRSFTIPRHSSETPLRESGTGVWQSASPKTCARWSATGYFFAKELRRELNVPVGIIHASWGGSRIESWMPREALGADLSATAKNIIRIHDEYPVKFKEYLDGVKKWENLHHRADRPRQGVPNDLPWRPLKSKDFMLSTGNGATWMRAKITILQTQTVTMRSLRCSGVVREYYFDGKKIGGTSLEDSLKGDTYIWLRVPNELVSPGEHEIAVRVFHSDGIRRKVSLDAIHRAPLAQRDAEFAEEFTFPALSRAEIASFPKSPGSIPLPHSLPSRMFNAMIHPLAPYALRGVLWYQGESNAKDAEYYTAEYGEMIASWRQLFRRPELPFLHCQLANFKAKNPQPAKSDWAELRAAQTACLKFPHTGQAVLIDAGEAGDIHPLDKQIVGKRLAAVALSKTYGKAIPCAGPSFKSAEYTVNGRVIVNFHNLEGGLVAGTLPENYPVWMRKKQYQPLRRNAPEGELEGFALAGKDGKWHWANAKITDDEVLVWSDNVPSPTAVRYGWEDNPTCNLYNRAGFPAVPFQHREIPL